MLALCEYISAMLTEVVFMRTSSSSSTKGLGRTQPQNWQDAGEALGNPALKGVHMPKGPTGDVKDRNDIYLQYNEVSRLHNPTFSVAYLSFVLAVYCL